MSPSLRVNGFKWENFDPKPRHDLMPRWKRFWISWETEAIAGTWLAGGCSSDCLAEPGVIVSWRGAGPYNEPGWVESWECQLAQPQVTRVPLSSQHYSNQCSLDHCLYHLSDHGRNGKGRAPSLKAQFQKGRKSLSSPSHSLELK